MRMLDQEWIDAVVQAVKAAGALLLDPAAIERITAKGQADFVTNVDLTVQETLRAQLEKLVPEVQFMGEEGDRTAIDPDRPFWILDPVDGTTNLIHHFDHSAVSLALAWERQVRFGVVYHPYRKACFTAQQGAGAFCNGLPIQTSAVSKLEDSLISVGTVPGYRQLADEAFYQMRVLYDCCQDVRRTGCASLDLCDMACGRLDGYVELMLQPWDYAAGLLIVTETGGTVTAPDGAPVSLLQGGGVLASNGRLHSAIQEKLSKTKLT